MTTAREQAREAAWSADDAWQDTNKHESIIIVHADAASDVWEPLLRDMVELCEWLMHPEDQNEPEDIDRMRLARAKEALA